MGTTSACAENTHPATHNNALSRNYLRVRGEYALDYLHGLLRTELPPRARRILGRYRAGNPNRGNYLRVRGEYRASNCQKLRVSELPPRARRILEVWMDQLGKSGTTSACAENTVTLQHQRQVQRNYLRVRGEYGGGLKITASSRELPPRARRIRGSAAR